MLHHIKVDYQPHADTSYHTSIAYTNNDALAEFNRLTAIWPDRLITVVAYHPYPEFITSNDEDLNRAFVAKREAAYSNFMAPKPDWYDDPDLLSFEVAS